MSVGKLNEFNVKCGAWSSYVDRLNMYFKVNKTEDEMKLPILIASIGDEAYELLENLASPKKPSELTFIAVDEMMQTYLQPTPSALAERYRFRQRRQNAGENMSTYVAELKKLSKHCKFGGNLNENLRDQFICGLRSDVIRQRLFAEDDTITFASAFKLATSLEAAERDAAIVEEAGISAGATETGSVHAITQSWRGRPSNRSAGVGAKNQYGAYMNNSSGTNKCEACGGRNHDQGNCRFREYVCSKCHKTGHLRRVCPGGKTMGMSRGADRRQGQGPSRAATWKPARNGLHFGDADSGSGEECGEDLEEELHHLCLNNYKSVSVSVQIDKTTISMEIDTGTAISCISKVTYDNYFAHLSIESDNTVLKFYDGSKIKPLGIIKPLVNYKGYSKHLELFVISGGTTSLLGRQWLAELKIKVPLFNCNMMSSKGDPSNNGILKLFDRYKELFDGGLGRYTGGAATLRVRPGATPVFHRARPLPYALRERVDAELDAMLRAGVIEPVDCSDWASPLVPINKPDGSLRICADYKATLNPSLLVDRYPLPKIEDVLVNLNGYSYFSKIDLSQAYNQVELDESKKFTVINTHRGLFRYNRLVYGLSSSVGIFQRIMTNLLGDIPNVQIFLDDVIIGGKSKLENLQTLEAVFQRLQSNGLKLKKSKCTFFAEEVTYLGYVVSREGIKPDKSKIEAIVKMKQPENVSQLRSFLGTVNFFGRFIRNLSTTLSPLYNLLRKGVDWDWDSECDRSYAQVKHCLTSASVLAHYEPRAPLIATCDASSYGLGAVLTQRGPGGERPVAFASRTLNDAEKNYSQIHREALAIIFCIKKFHQYLFGRRFTLRTDHKPLVSIFNPNKGIPTMTASRMQRWAIILSAYDYEIEYVNTNDNCADSLSRLPTQDTLKNSSSREEIPEQTYLHFAQEAMLLDYNQIRKQTSKDPMLGRVLTFVRDGWPEECEIRGLKPYFNRKSEIYEELGCLMWGYRLIVPERCRDGVLDIIHEPHMGIVKSKALARSYVWWPGVDEAVEAACRACSVCAGVALAPPRHAPRPWPWPARPWSRIHMDFMGPLFGKLYLVVIDARSKWLEIFEVSNTSANSTIGKLRELWSRWGIPKQVVSDNGPPFTSREFNDFLSGDGIDHIFTAPYHPASNGAAENAVKTLKNVIKKSVVEGIDIQKSLNNFLLYYRNTEHCSTGESPSMLMMGRRLRTHLDLLKPDRENKILKSQSRQVELAGGSDRKLEPGSEVWYRQYLKGEKWQPGEVSRSLGSTDYSVIDKSGNVIHRHIDQLRRRSRKSLACPIKSNLDNTKLSEPKINSPQKLDTQSAQSSEVKLSAVPVPSPRARSVAEGEAEDEDCFATPEKQSSSPGAPAPDIPSDSPVPHQTRLIRKCRLVNVPKYKF